MGRKKFLQFTAVAFFSFLYGVASTHYRFFPFPQLVAAKYAVTGRSLAFPESRFVEYPLWKERTTLFDLLPSTARNVMAGDSLTERGEWTELFPKASIVNRGIGGDTVYGVSKRISNIIKSKPSKVFIMVGINDLIGNRSFNRKLEKICEEYSFIVNTLLANGITPVIQSTLYVGKGYKHSERVNADVDKLNRYISGCAYQNHITFIDLNSVLSDHGFLKPDVTVDNIHLNGDGYKLWKYAISEFIED